MTSAVPNSSPARRRRAAVPALSVRRIVGGFAILSLGSVLMQVIGFVALAIASRRLGPANLGAYNFAYGVALYFQLPSDFGITLLGIRDMAREPERAREVMGEVMALQVVIAAVAFLVLVVAAPLIAADHTSRLLLPITGAVVLVNAIVSFHWALRAFQRMRAVALTEVLGQLLYGVLVATLLAGGVSGAVQFAWFHFAGAALAAVLTLWIAWRALGVPRISFDRRMLLRRLRASATIGISFAMIQIYYSVDSLMLGYIKGTAAVGQYGVAYKLPLAIISYASLWVAALYPHASAMFVRSRELLREQVEMFANLAVVVALPLGVGATFACHGLMRELFGGHYGPATAPFVLLVWAAAIVVVSVNFGNVLIACGEERRYARAVTAGALLNIGVNVAAIPLFGTVGAATATIAAELIVVILMARRFTHVLGPIRPDTDRLWRICAACALLAGALIAMPQSLPAAVRVAAGAGVYAVAALSLGAVRRSELRLLLPRRRSATAAPDPAPGS